MMEEDFGDEDVELENSPLYLYMRDCDNDRIKELQEKSERKTAFSTSNAMNNFYHRITKFRLTSKLKNVLKRYIGYQESLDIYDDAYRISSRSAITNCSVLLEDDADFLENVMNDELLQVNVNEARTFSSKILLFAVGLGCCKLRLNEINCAFGAVLVSYSVFCIIKLLKRKRDIRKSIEVNEKYVKSCEEFIRSSNKCLMYIKELEIYGRGLLLPVPEFSLARVENSSLFVSNSLMPLPKMCLLNSLRVTLFEELKKEILQSRSALFQIIKQYPTSREIDNEQNYMAFFKSKELDALLDLENVSSPESNEISSSSLKSLFQLLHLHLSELLRRLCVCFCPIVVSSSSSKDVFDLFIISDAVLKPYTQTLNSSTRRLNEGYKLHSYFSSSWKKDYRMKREIDENKSQAFNSSLKGLSLHFVASLARIQEIVERLDSMESASSDDVDAYCTIASHLQLIQQDVKAGQFCLDESVARLMKMRGYPQQEEEEELEIKLPNVHMDPSIPVIPMSENVDLASADQVFEAYVDSNENNGEEDGEYYDEEIDKIAVKQREISKTMFAELKQVLIPKAKEWKVREAKALGMTELEAEEEMLKEDSCEKFETEDVKVKKVRKRIICGGDVDFVSENNDDCDSSSPINNHFEHQLETNFSNNFMAAVASLAANRARNNLIQEDECFESDD